MPLYEFECEDCSAACELLVRSGDTPACPSCGGANLTRMLSTFATSSAERSRATLRAARKAHAQSKNRQERLRHEGQELREHIQDHYGLDLDRKKPSTPDTAT